MTSANANHAKGRPESTGTCAAFDPKLLHTALNCRYVMQNSGGWTALHEAAVNGQAEVIQQLVALGALVADRTREGDTALHKAARWGHAHVVELLLSLGSNVNAVDYVSSSP